MVPLVDLLSVIVAFLGLVILSCIFMICMYENVRIVSKHTVLNGPIGRDSVQCKESQDYITF